MTSYLSQRHQTKMIFPIATVVLAYCVKITTACEVKSYDTVTEANLPLVDIKDAGLPFKIVAALEDWGFAYIKNHDVPGEVTENAYRQNQNFFNLPERAKRQVQANRFMATKTARGYTPHLFERLDVSPGGKPDIKEVLDVGYTDPGSNSQHYLGQNLWPSIPRQQQQTNENNPVQQQQQGSNLPVQQQINRSNPIQGQINRNNPPIVQQRYGNHPVQQHRANPLLQQQRNRNKPAQQQISRNNPVPQQRRTPVQQQRRPPVQQQRRVQAQQQRRQPFQQQQQQQQIRNVREARDLGDEMKQEVDAYAAEMSTLAKTLLSNIFTGIGCSREVLQDVFGPNALQVLRLTRYPSLDEYLRKDPGQIGAGPHSDYGGITLLSARGPGLAVLKPNRTSGTLYRGTFSHEMGVPSSGDWVKVPALRGTFIAMAGEALQRLSNGQIFAIKHKVELSQTESRNSLAYFYDPRPEAMLRPLDCAVKDGPSLYREKLAGHKGVIRDPFPTSGY